MGKSKRSVISQEPLNELEESLLHAADDPASGAAFYRSLMESNLFLVGRMETVEGKVKEGSVSAEPGDRLVLWPRGEDQRVHVFTSLERLRAAIGAAQVPYVGLPTDVLFAAVDPDLEIILNEGVWHGKQILPEERRALIELVPPGAPG
ncbi:MAG: SseB family protein [Candidatus Dormibacteria bacterium]